MCDWQVARLSKDAFKAASSKEEHRIRKVQDALVAFKSTLLGGFQKAVSLDKARRAMERRSADSKSLGAFPPIPAIKDRWGLPGVARKGRPEQMPCWG